MSYVLVAATLAAAVVFGVFLSMVRARFFARLDAGFLVALTLAVGGFSLVIASLFGLWGYERGRAILVQMLHKQLSNLADVIEEETIDDISNANMSLVRMVEEVASVAPSMDEAAVRRLLLRVQDFDPRFMHIDVVNGDGKLIVSDRDDHAIEAPNATAAAYALQGKPFTSDPFFSPEVGRYLLSIAVPITDSSGISGAVTAWYDIQTELVDLLVAARFGETGNAVLVDGTGRIFAHPDPALVGRDVSSFAAIQNALSGQRGWVRQPNQAGIDRLFVYRPMPKVTTVESKPWILLTGIDTSEAFASIHALTVEFAIGFVAIVVACVLLSRQLAVSIRHPVQELVRFAHQVRDGDLQQRVAIEGRDEMGQLGNALNEMVAGLAERDRVKEIFGRYVTTSVSEKILQGGINLGGERRNLTMLFSDIRNFTAMSEHLPPEEVVGFLNHYFSEMVDAVFEHSGVLDKFIGDGLLALFGALDETPDHARRAVLTGLRMEALVGKINGERAALGKAPIAIGIGIHTDDVVVGNIGSRRRLEYTVIGDGVNTCARVESLNKEFGTTILITESTYAVLGNEFVCREMPEAHLKGKTHAPKIFEVVSAKTEAARSALDP